MTDNALTRTPIVFEDEPTVAEPTEYVRQPFPLLVWWMALDGQARAFMVGLTGLTIGFGMVALPLAFIVPSVVITLDAMGLSFDRRPPE